MTMLFAAVLLTVTAFASPAFVRAEEPGAAARLTALANATRNEAGLGSLPTNAELVAGACVWAQHLADNNSIDHDSNLFASGGGLSDNWTKIGENTGAGGEIAPLHETFVAPAGQYSNFTDADFNAIGVCVRSDSAGQLFVVERFAAVSSKPVAAPARPPVTNPPATTRPPATNPPTTNPPATTAVPVPAPVTTVPVVTDTPVTAAATTVPVTTTTRPPLTAAPRPSTTTTTTTVSVEDPTTAMPAGTGPIWSAPPADETQVREVDDGLNIWTVIAGFMSILCAVAAAILLYGRKTVKPQPEADDYSNY